MIAMIFEVWPDPDHRESYLGKAAELRPLLETIPGFISVERFSSLHEPGKLLSLAFFEDESALHAWRNRPEHREAQRLGRATFLNDYRLRIASVQRDYGMDRREEAPADSCEYHAKAR